MQTGSSDNGITRDYDAMSRQQLIDLIGGDIDPSVNRADLVLLAKSSEELE